MSEANVLIIREFIACWSQLDADLLVDYFADDGIYHNIPAAPVQGRENLRTFISGFISNWTSTHWEMRTLVGSGDTVVAERVDHTMVGDISIDLPCCGIFEMSDGKIKVWRDYFDMATYTKPLAGN